MIKIKSCLLIIMFFMFMLHTFSVNATQQEMPKVNIHLKDVSLKEFIEDIEKKTDYTFIFNSSINLKTKISVTYKQGSIPEILAKAFSNKNIVYEISGSQILLKEVESVSPLQKGQLTSPAETISGVIIDAAGDPLIGVTVSVKGTTIGSHSDHEGKFTIKVQVGATIVFSYVGFKSKEIVVRDNTLLTITLQEDAQQLDEVVVVGYGVQKKANLTGSVSSIKYDKELENRPITDPSQALSGKMTGVWVSQNSGSPGSDGATIRIRGYGTLNNTNPLILIDGVEGRLAEVNPNDIASITVLKDAASAAIYGSRAANGVILLETKRGEANDKVTINYNGYFGIQKLGKRYDIISNSAEYMQLWNSALINSNSDAMFPNDVIEAFKNGTDPYKYPNTNYYDEVYRTSFTTQHNISATVGSKKTNSYFSVSYLKNEGIMKNTETERFSLNLNSEAKLNDRLRIGARARMMRKITDRPYDISRIVYMMANGYPFSTPYLQDGKTYGGTQTLYLSGPKTGQPIVDTRNPFPDLYNGNQQYVNTFMKGNIYATIDILKGLSVTAQYSGQYNNNNQDKYNQMAYCYTDLDLSNKTKPLDYPSTLKVYRKVTDEYYGTFFVNANFNRTFNDIHEISAVLGYQQESLVYRVTETEKTDPSKDDLHQIVSGTKNPSASGNKYLWRMLSYFGRVNYAFRGKYLMEMNLRADASSRFAKENRWGYFPSFSAAWRLSEEPFMKDNNIFNNFKIRASWGQLGNQNIGSSSNRDYFPYLTTLTQDYATSYNFNNVLAPGAAIKELVDRDITWETTTTTDIGVDLGFLKNRLTIEADYFKRETKDIIVQLPIPLLMGDITAPLENIGKMKNAGVEINMAWEDNLPATGLSYRIGANVTFLSNEVVKFRDDSPDQLYLIREGYSYKTLYGYVSEGVYQTNEEAKNHMHSNGYTPTAGDLKYKDVNNDGKLDYRDKQEIGNTIPKITYGINGSIAWKGFDLSFLFTGTGKVNAYMQNAWTEPLGISGGVITTRWRDAWTPENPSNTLPMIKVNDTWNRQESSFWATDASWFKLKNIQLGYQVPSNLTKKLSLQSLYVYVNGTDLFTIVSSKYEGTDPERDTFTSGYDNYPVPRVLSVGLNITF